MADPTPVAVVETAPIAAAPATPAPEPAQAVVTPEAQTPAPAQEAAPAPVVALVEAPKAESLLGTELDKDAPKPAPAVIVEPKKTEEGQSVEPAPPPPEAPKEPTYEPFKAPEGVTLTAEKTGEFTKLLAELEVSGKAEHAIVQEVGQKAVDFHIAEMKRVTEEIPKFYQEVWEKQKSDWRDATKADPEIGGNRFDTSLTAARNFIRTHGGTAEQQQEFRNLMESSGLGNHPAMIRLLAKANSVMSEGQPLAAKQPVQQEKSKVRTLYNKS